MLTFAIATISCGILALLLAGFVVARMDRMLENVCQQATERARDDSINFERMASGRCVDAERNAALHNRMAQAMTEYVEMSNFKLAMAKEQMELEHELRLAQLRSGGGDDVIEPPDDFGAPYADPDPIIPMGVTEHAP